MSYEKIDGVPVMTNEFAVKLDSGYIVAVSISRSSQGSWMLFEGMARAIYLDGMPMIGQDGQPIVTRLAYKDVRAPDADLVLKDCILALLGETPQFITWGAQWLLDASIRQAIAVSFTNNFDPSNLI